MVDKKSCHSLLPRIGCIPVPNDIHELRFIPALIDKIPKYINKMNELENQIDKLSKNIVKQDPLLHYSKIKQLIYKAFFIEMENRSYNNRFVKEDKGDMGDFDYEYRNVCWGETISNRNTACEVCGENRTTDQCHIIPRKLGGTLNPDNILILCPTHHRLLDHFMLSKAEFSSINWSVKSIPSQHYVNKVTLPNHQKFWERVKNENYSPISVCQQSSEEWEIYRYTLIEILNCFTYKNMISRSSLMKVLDHNVKMIAKQLLKLMLKKEILLVDEKKRFLILAKNNLEIDDISKECWRAFN